MRRLTSFVRRSFAAAIAFGAIVSVAPAVSRASLIFYTSQSAFDAAAPGLPVDPFASNFVFSAYPNNFAYHSRPINSSTNDSLIPAGCILPGLAITTTTPLTESQSIKAEGNGAGVLSIGTGTFQDVLVLQFSTPVSAFGTEVFGHVYPGPVFPGNVEVTVYNGATQLDYNNPTLPSAGHGFVGEISSTADITSVTLLFNPANDSSDSNTFVTNVTFGDLPEPSSVALFGACGFSLFRWRRRQIAPIPRH